MSQMLYDPKRASRAGFLTAEALNTTEAEREALILALECLEAGDIGLIKYDDVPYRAESGEFDPIPDKALLCIGIWRERHDCGTVCCVGGLAEVLGNVRMEPRPKSPMAKLFFAYGKKDCTVSQAARATRNVLERGDPMWDEERERQ